MAYAAAEAADGDPDCTTGQPPTVTPEFEAGYLKGAADCAGITARLDGVEALRADVMTVVSDPHLTWEQARQALWAALSK